MREILFKGKVKAGYKWEAEGEWIEGSLIYPDNENGTICQIASSYLSSNNDGSVMVVAYEIDPETICQYTGLTDKNGRKIFEGDIVRYKDEVLGKVKTDEIKYNETHAAFCRLHKGETGLQYLFIDEAIANKCEVVGNIFENPELVEESTNGIEELCRYIVKDPQGKKRWSSSRNLVRPIELPNADQKYTAKKIERIAKSNTCGKEFFAKQFPGYDIANIETIYYEETGWHIYLKMWKKAKKSTKKNKRRKKGNDFGGIPERGDT